ncbi:MAG: glycoside hydrolase family 97 N-terminal domain-containing protein, partial [Bacteroidaceae bacterium]|nr:glycoside hydrolase family 97 N-terminal domain-containing protein [Bacteroidaceae bacterium]
MKRFSSLLLVVVLFAMATLAQTTRTLTSPNGKLKTVVTLADGITYDVFLGDELVMDDCRLSLNVGGNVLGSKPQLKQASQKSVNEIKKPFLRLKYAEVPNVYNELTLKMKGNYSVIFRAYDDGIAYRFVTSLGKEVKVYDEDISVFFPEETDLVLQTCGSFVTSYEERYSFLKTGAWT